MTASGNQTILVVDDESAIRKIIVRLLGNICPAWNVEEAADLPEAKQKIMALEPRLVISDVQLPSGNGTELCRLIQEHPRFSRTRVLIITGYPDARVREKAFERGACEFLPKPFHLGELAGSIGRLLA